MRALIQRVSRGAVSVGDRLYSQIGPGLAVLFGAGAGDKQSDAAYLARKTANLRIFADSAGKMNLSLLDTGGEILVVSQFTLYADTRRGNRPGFEPAAPLALAEPLYELYLAELRGLGLAVQSGVFGAEMQVEIVNDGPVTIMLDTALR